MAYQPIENYGIIGNMRTVALVGMNGSIDWYCYPTSTRPASSGQFWMTTKEAGSRFAPLVIRCGTNSSIGLPPMS